MTAGRPQSGSDASTWPGRYVGQVVYIFAYDVAYDMKRQAVPTILGRRVESLRIDPGKRGPRQAFFYQPQTAHLPPEQREGLVGPVRLERTVKLFPVGAISISVRVDFAVDSLAELVAYHELRFQDGTLLIEVQRLAEQIAADLRPYCIGPVDTLQEAEAYTVFCLKSSGPDRPFNAEAWLRENRRSVAALLMEETNVTALSGQETGDSTDSYLSYYQYDLAIVDWDAALLIDEPGRFDEVLHILELGNVQLAELAAYDRVLDVSLDRAYRDLAGRKIRGLRQTVRDLGELRVDLARLNDELSNTAKFVGDWHLARLYQNLSLRFHLGDWQRIIADKLRTLDSLYQILKQDQSNRWMILLELAIVLLFILDLIVLFAGLE